MEFIYAPKSYNMRIGAGLNMLPMLLPNYYSFILVMLSFMMFNYSSLVIYPIFINNFGTLFSKSLCSESHHDIEEKYSYHSRDTMRQIMKEDTLPDKRNVILVSFVFSVG